jgi:hypothetical protein
MICMLSLSHNNFTDLTEYLISSFTSFEYHNLLWLNLQLKELLLRDPQFQMENLILFSIAQQ